MSAMLTTPAAATTIAFGFPASTILRSGPGVVRSMA
jgi:hypothetical protein